MGYIVGYVLVIVAGILIGIIWHDGRSDRMIEIKSAKNKRSDNYEWCSCCRQEKKTDRITFSQDGTGGISIVLCDDCQKALLDALKYKE